jgi:osmotically-inducible protein OsmY
MERRRVGLIMNDVFKDLYTSMKGKKSVFNFLSDEDFENLSAFFESKHIPAGEYIDDSNITMQANAIIIKEPDANYLKIDVSSTNGNVVLTGFIHDKKAEERIVAKIRLIKGLKSVKSNLKVEIWSTTN